MATYQATHRNPTARETVLVALAIAFWPITIPAILIISPVAVGLQIGEAIRQRRNKGKENP